MQEFKKIKAKEGEVIQLQDNLVEFFTNFKQSSALLDGVLLKDITLAVGSNDVSHKLNKKLTGYIVVKKNANSNIWDTSSDDRILKLSASVATTISLWVF